MSTSPEVYVKLTDAEFTLGELEAFIERARSIDGMSQDALVAVRVTNAVVTTKTGDGPMIFELSCSDAYRSKS